MFEVLTANMHKIDSSDVLNRLALEKDKYFVVSAHREENINSQKNINGLITSLNIIAEKYRYPIIVSTHPRTRKKLVQLNLIINNELQIPNTKHLTTNTKHQTTNDKHQTTNNEHQTTNNEQRTPNNEQRTPNNEQLNPLIQLMKPLGFHDYNHLQKNAFAVLSDSGTISEESSIMNFRALNIREAHERPEAMEEASVMMVGLNPERISQGLVQLQYQKIGDERTFRRVGDYSMPNVSEKVVKIILSYTDYIKRIVWSES